MKIVIKLAKPLVPPIEHRLLDDRHLPTTTVKILFLLKQNEFSFVF